MRWWLFPFLVACSGKDDTASSVDPLAWAVDEEGPYKTGHRTWEITYDAPPEGEARTLVLHAWYPTEDTDGDEVKYLGAILDEDSFGNAAEAAPVYDGRYPVHVHSHGFQGWGGTSSDLMQYFASHGWVAIAPDHTGNTLTDHVDPLPTAHYLQKPADISAALDALDALPADDPLAAADTSRVVMSGHSFGCYSTWAAAGASYDLDAVTEACPGLYEGTCSQAELDAFAADDLADDRVVAAIPMAGNLRREFFGAEGHAAVHAPFLFMTGSDDDVGMHEQFDTYTDVDRRWIDIEGGCHQAFALGECAELDTETGYAIVNTYALAFARLHVLGDGDATVAGIVDGSVAVSPLVTFTGP